jgi:putative two-component system response regulator
MFVATGHVKMIAEKLLLESRILVVDDSPTNLILLERLLEWVGYARVKSTTSSAQALDLCTSFVPDLVILDLEMRELDGYEVLRLVREREGRASGIMPILIFSADTTPQAKERALALGANDFLTKPGDATEIKLRIRTFLQLRHMQKQVADHSVILQQKVEERTLALWESQKEIVERLTRIAAFRDDPTGEHCRRVGSLSAELARELGMDRAQVEIIRLASPLHDLGKLGLPESLVQTRGLHSTEQRRECQTHAVIGGDLLSGGRSPLLVTAASIAKHHHENWDGTGYPSGLAGENIPLAARIVAVADAFDAMMFNIEYRKAFEPSMAIAEIASGNGTKYDPAVVVAFLKLVGEGRHMPKFAAVAA